MCFSRPKMACHSDTNFPPFSLSQCFSESMLSTTQIVDFYEVMIDELGVYVIYVYCTFCTNLNTEGAPSASWRRIKTMGGEGKKKQYVGFRTHASCSISHLHITGLPSGPTDMCFIARLWRSQCPRYIQFI